MLGRWQVKNAKHLGEQSGSFALSVAGANKCLLIILGCPESLYSNLETGRYDPVFSTLIRIAQALDLKLAEILEGF